MTSTDHDMREGEVSAGPDDPREVWRSLIARPGGNREKVHLTDRQKNILDVVMDELIPAAGGFPAPSEVGVVEEFVTRYLTPDDAVTCFFPYARESEFTQALDRLGERLLDMSAVERVAELARWEDTEPEFFGQLRTLTYAGYYSRPPVVQVIREVLEAGRDYHGPPLPYGYAEVTADWSGETPPAGVGSYIPTDAVTRAIP